MSYIFDSSAIFRAVRENLVELLSGSYTLELARYELGNALWKEYALHGRIDIGELKKLAILVKDALGLLNLLAVECREEEVLALAGKLRLTFYDAAYVYFARENKLSLVTEDVNLLNKIKPTVKTLTLSALVK